jgi:hypothetical protein
VENFVLVTDFEGHSTIVNFDNVKFVNYYATAEPGVEFHFIDGTTLIVSKQEEETQRVWALLKSRVLKDQPSGPVDFVSSGEKLASAKLQGF